MSKDFFDGFPRWNERLLMRIKKLWKTLKTEKLEKSENTVIYLPPLIDKPSIKLTDTCVRYLLGCSNMYTNSQCNRLNTIAMRASLILHILTRFPWWKPWKSGGGLFPPPPRKKPKRKPVCLFEFWGKTFKLARFQWNRRDCMWQDCLVLSWTHS